MITLKDKIFNNCKIIKISLALFIAVPTVLFLVLEFLYDPSQLFIIPTPMYDLYLYAMASGIFDESGVCVYIFLALAIIIPLLLGFLFLKPCKFKTLSNIILLVLILSDIVLCCYKVESDPLRRITETVLDLIFAAMIIALMRLDKKVIKEKRIQKLQTES